MSVGLFFGGRWGKSFHASNHCGKKSPLLFHSLSLTKTHTHTHTSLVCAHRAWQRFWAILQHGETQVSDLTLKKTQSVPLPLSQRQDIPAAASPLIRVIKKKNLLQVVLYYCDYCFTIGSKQYKYCKMFESICNIVVFSRPRPSH